MEISIRRLVFVAGIGIFVVLGSIGEFQVRSSAKWPPPSHHEVGAWTVETPKILDCATGLNLPASVPILWLWAHNDAFASAYDDHRLVIYVPWLVLVSLLWYFVGVRVQEFVHKRQLVSRAVSVGIQLFLTLELLYVAAGLVTAQPGVGLTQVLFFWLWVVLVSVGWLVLFANWQSQAVAGHAGPPAHD